MTDESNAAARGYGPFHEEAEPTAPIVRQRAGDQPGAVVGNGQPEPVSPEVPRPATPPSGSPVEPDVTVDYGAAQPAGTYDPPSVSPADHALETPTTPYDVSSSNALPPGYLASTGPISGIPTSVGSISGPPTSASPANAGPAYRTPAPESPADRTPAPESPAYGSPASGLPASGLPASGLPASGLPASGLPASGAPTSGSPAYSYPTSGAPTPEYPTSGHPISASPISAGPTSGPPTYAESVPTSDPYGFGPPPSRGPRIEPSPPPDRSHLIRGLIAGLLAGLILFGTAGWLIGRATPESPEAVPTTPAKTSTPPALGVFEQSQLALNKPSFPDSLGTISQGWLPYVSGCSRSGTTDGPALNPGEKVRVRCTLGGMSAIFVEYQDTAARDKARVKVLGQNVDARSLTPGVGATVERPTPSGRTTGNYVEYAYKIDEQGRSRTVSGLWWDDAQAPIAAYLLAYWTEGVGESWAPMRDIWNRYA